MDYDKNQIDREILQAQGEERKIFYRDLETILDDGFLTHTCVYNGVDLVFRSTLPRDNRRISSLSKGTDDYTYMAWALANQVWLVDGYEIDPYDNTDGSFYLFHNFFKKLHKTVLLKLYFILVGLRNRFHRSLRLVEAYFYENYSRSRWSMTKFKTNSRETSLTYKLWEAYNSYEDVRLEQMRQWEHTKVLAGSMSAKAFKEIGKLTQRMDEAHLKNAKEAIENAINAVIYGESALPKPEPVKVTVDGKEYVVPVRASNASVDELIDEMKIVMRGEQDYHDMIMAEYNDSIKRAAEYHQKLRQEKLKELQGDSLVEGHTDLQGLSADDIQKRRSSRTNTGTLTDSTHTYLYDKYVAPKIVVGVLGEKGPIKATTQNSNIQVPTDNKPSLQESIASRTPKIK